jgi:hypothetical protein
MFFTHFLNGIYTCNALRALSVLRYVKQLKSLILTLIACFHIYTKH